MTRTLPILIALGFLSHAIAEAPTPPKPAVEYKGCLGAMDLAEGDTVVFLGDSITHQCLYTQYIEDYFYTRRPATRLHFHNAGVNADFAVDGAMRFDDDVTPMHPKYVTLLFGMNDAAYRPFDQEKFDSYQENVTNLINRIQSLGATPVLMTPTMYDVRASRILNTDPGLAQRENYYNGVLALYGAWLRDQAETHGFGFVDMYSPLNNVTTKKRKQDPIWTTINDGLHPAATGQCIMAGAILRDVVKPTVVSEIALAEKNGRWSVQQAENATVSDLKMGGDTLSFTVVANALPWVLPADTVEGVKLARLDEFNQEKLAAHGLKPGIYILKIDGVVVEQRDAEAWAAGVELQSNPKTPEYQQAAQVARLNQERNDTVYRPLRTEFQNFKGKRQNLAKAAYDKSPQLEELKAKLEQSHTELLAKMQEMLGKAKTLEDQIYTVNKPRSHQYEITPAAGSSGD